MEPKIPARERERWKSGRAGREERERERNLEKVIDLGKEENHRERKGR